MNNSSPTNTTASSLPAGKITRKQLASHYGFCVRTIDELTRTGVLGHFKIGKSIRYDLAEVEATLRQRFHVPPVAQGRAGCPQPAAPKPMSTGEKQNLQENLRPAVHGIHTAAANAGTLPRDEHQETPGGGLRTSRPTSRRAPARATATQPTQA